MVLVRRVVSVLIEKLDTPMDFSFPGVWCVVVSGDIWGGW